MASAEDSLPIQLAFCGDPVFFLQPGTLWRVVPSSELPIGSTEALFEATLLLYFSYAQFCLFPSLFLPRVLRQRALPNKLSVYNLFSESRNPICDSWWKEGPKRGHLRTGFGAGSHRCMAGNEDPLLMVGKTQWAPAQNSVIVKNFIPWKIGMADR